MRREVLNLVRWMLCMKIDDNMMGSQAKNSSIHNLKTFDSVTKIKSQKIVQTQQQIIKQQYGRKILLGEEYFLDRVYNFSKMFSLCFSVETNHNH